MMLHGPDGQASPLNLYPDWYTLWRERGTTEGMSRKETVLFWVCSIHLKRIIPGTFWVLCWLLEVSVGQNWPVRIPHAVSCSLPILVRKSTISSIGSLIFTKGNRHCAQDSHLHHAVDTLLSSAA